MYKNSYDETDEEVIGPDEYKRYFRVICDEEKIKNAKATFFIVKFEPGGEAPPHHHPEVEIFYGLKGTGVCELSNFEESFFKKYVIEPGTLIYCPHGWTHKIKNASESEEWECIGITFKPSHG